MKISTKVPVNFEGTDKPCGFHRPSGTSEGPLRLPGATEGL